MTNWLVGDHKVTVVDIDEGVLEGSHDSLVGDHQVPVVDVDEGVLEGSDMI